MTIYRYSRIFYIDHDLSKRQILHLEYIDVAKQISKQDHPETHQHLNFQQYKYQNHVQQYQIMYDND